MGLVRTVLCAGLMMASFYAGYKANDHVPRHYQKLSIEDKIVSLMKEDKKDLRQALYKVGRQYGFEK